MKKLFDRIETIITFLILAAILGIFCKVFPIFSAMIVVMVITYFLFFKEVEGKTHTSKRVRRGDVY